MQEASFQIYFAAWCLIYAPWGEPKENLLSLRDSGGIVFW
jgi:hypothetical protein